MRDFRMRLHPKTDADIIELLEQADDKSKLVKDALRTRLRKVIDEKIIAELELIRFILEGMRNQQ